MDAALDHRDHGEATQGARAPAGASSKKRTQRRQRIAQERTDFASYLLAMMVRASTRLPGWQMTALTHLSKTESASVALLKPAISVVSEDRLRKLMTKHIQDEERHARVFEERLMVWRELCGDKNRAPLPPPAGGAGRMNLMQLMALFEIGEMRGFQGVTAYRKAFTDDPETVAVMDSVVRDEHFHCTYVHLQMERWKEQGFAKEVAAARKHALKQDREAFYRLIGSFIAMLPSLLLAELTRPFRRQPKIGASS